jgi:hypothetical protein
VSSINDKAWEMIAIDLEGARISTVSLDEKSRGIRGGEKQSNLYRSRTWRNTLEAGKGRDGELHIRA